MTTIYNVRLYDPFGALLATIGNYADGPGGGALEYVLNASPGGMGMLQLTVPGTFDASLFFRDGRLIPFRSIAGSPPAMDNNACYLVERLDFPLGYTRVTARSVKSLTERRIVAYAAGSSYASKTATAADNQIKTIWKENAGASISAADRDGAETQADISAYVTTQANLGQGASIAKAFSRRNTADVFREFSEASQTAGTYLTYDIIAPGESTLELRTYAGQRGVDHSATSASPVILSVGRGNLANPVLTRDYSQECTFAIAGGTDTGTARRIATQSDSARMGQSPFGRIERFFDMANVSDTTQLQDDADAGVRNGRPVVFMVGDLIETPATTRGIHFDLGDIVIVEDPQTQQRFDARIDVIRIAVAGGGQRSMIGLRSL
jgi:Siphovirus ReqiPepy6 Gp37-like protein